MTSPRISVVVAFFNNEDDLADCLDSIAAQTFTDTEVIMVDDGSTDGSADIARAKAAADPRFTLIKPEHGGPGGARNRGQTFTRCASACTCANSPRYNAAQQQLITG